MKLWRSVTSKLKAHLPIWLAALWWGSLTTVGFLVVPLLFIHLPTPAIAGAMAAKLFAAQTWVSLFCGLLMLVLLIKASNEPLNQASRARGAIIFIALGLTLATLSAFFIAPQIVAKVNLRWWHAAGSSAYVLQWLCAAAVFYKVGQKDI